MVEATGANGVTYTLTVPPEAVEFLTAFGLTPVSSIDGLPLSGGLMGAVSVEPQGIEFNLPLLLEITPGEVAAPALVGDGAMAFAVTPVTEGNEFYFIPQLSSTVLYLSGSAGGALARPAGRPPAAVPSYAILVTDGKVVGVASGTTEEVRNTIRDHPPSSLRNGTVSRYAGAIRVDPPSGKTSGACGKLTISKGGCPWRTQWSSF